MDEPLSLPKKKPSFGEIEDVVSIGALLRPTIVKAVSELKTEELEGFLAHIISAERELADGQRDFRARFSGAQEVLRSLYPYAPIWRFIVGRIEETWKEAPELSVKELSLVSLLLGIMLEETQSRMAQKKSKRAA